MSRQCLSILTTSLVAIGFWATGHADEPESRSSMPSQAHSSESLGAQPTSGFEQVRNWPHNSLFYQASTPVGYLDTELENGGHLECSATVIGRNLVLTARHCIRDKHGNPVQIKVIRFWLGDTHTDGGTPYTVDKKWIDIGKEKDDDFIVFAATPAFEVRALRIPPIGTDPYPNQHLYIYHFPSYQPLTLTRFNCWATVDKTEDDTKPTKEDAILRHTCDTQPGSSGAPILNEDFQIVGIHIADGKSEKEGSFNEGLLISRIVQASSIVKDALSQGQGTIARLPEVAATQEGSSSSYRTEGGDVFLLAGKKWYLVPEGSALNSRVPLKQQGQSDQSYTLWDPIADVLYEFPVNGGVLRKQQAQEGQWDEVGSVVKQ